MNTVLNNTTPKARKNYHCDGCALLGNDMGYYWDEMTFSEKKEIAKAYRKGWRILKGEQYYKQVGVYCGDFYTTRVIPNILKICNRLDAWGDE